jgi:hypothetical protein
MDMTFFWLVFLGCAVSAWLIGYGMGYLRGVREAITANVRSSDVGFSGDRSGGEIEASMPRWMFRFAPSRYIGEDRRATSDKRPGGLI